MPFCTNCGSKIPEPSRFCSSCGQPVEDGSSPAPNPGSGGMKQPQPPTPAPIPTSVSDSEYQMALMAMKGNRSEEAVARFNELLLRENSPKIWCGLGIAKASLILVERSTIEEVSYCFRKAIDLDPSQKKTVEALYADITLKLMSDLGAFCQRCYEQAQKQSTKMLLGGVTMGIGAAVGLSKRDTLFTNLVGVAGVAGGAAAAFNAHSQINEIKLGYAQGVQLYNLLYRSCFGFLSQDGEPFRIFEQSSIELKSSYHCLSGRKADQGTPLLIFGILSLVLSCLGPLIALPTLIISIMHLKEMDRDERSDAGRTKTTTAAVLSGIAMAIFVIFMISRA